MSRIGLKPIAIPDGVKVAVEERTVRVEGPLGKLEYAHPEGIEVRLEDTDGGGRVVRVSRADDERQNRAYHGLVRALIQNMIVGVKTGYEKKLELVGVGYVVKMDGKQLALRVGFKEPVRKTIPANLTVTVPSQTEILIKGADKQAVGQFAAEVRASRKPEPYKGKGVRYAGEQIKLKPGKSAK